MGGSGTPRYVRWLCTALFGNIGELESVGNSVGLGVRLRLLLVEYSVGMNLDLKWFGRGEYYSMWACGVVFVNGST